MQDNAWRISESLRESIMKEIDKSANILGVDGLLPKPYLL